MPVKPANAYYVPLQFEPLQDLLGGLPLGTITGFIGAPQAGKSTLMYQASIEAAMSMKQNILVFDTENKFHTYMELTNCFGNRYEVDLNLIKTDAQVTSRKVKDDIVYSVEWKLSSEPKEGMTNVFLLRCPDVKKILVLFGRGADIKVFESGKIQAMLLRGAWADEPLDAPICKFITDNDVGPVIIDSITQPFDEFPAVSSNFPARADLQQLWFIQIHKLAAEMYLPIMMAVHESVNPTGMYGLDLKMEGGKTVGYNLEYAVYMLLRNQKGLLPKGHAPPPTLADNQRALFIMRKPNTRSFARFRILDYASEQEGGFLPADE